MSKLRERQDFQLQDEAGNRRQRYTGGEELVSSDTGTLGSSAYERAQDVVETDDTSGLRGESGYVLAPD